MMGRMKRVVPVFGQRECGFTLIELMVSMAIGLLILAGLTTMLVSINGASRAIASRSDKVGDLYLASHLMQESLRESKAICWDASKTRIIYQPLDSTVPLDTAACSVVDKTHGTFEFRLAKSGKPTPYICWNRPNKGGGCQELIRGMNASSPDGLSASKSALIWTITLTASYINESKANKTLSLRFKTWPRN